MSSGNGGGSGFFDNTVNVESLSGKGNFFENAFADIVNYGIQASTGGWLGYENGKISNGVTTNVAKSTGQAVVSGIKEVTGAKAAEEANKMARDQFESAKADAEKARQDQIAQNAKDQMQQSQQAAAARVTAASRSSNKGTAVGGLILGQDEKDFLGL